MYNEKELKAALESQYSEKAIPMTMTDELQDHLNNLAMSQDRIEGLLEVLYGRLHGNNSNTVSVAEFAVADTKSLASLTGHAKELSIKLNDLGDKLAYLVNCL